MRSHSAAPCLNGERSTASDQIDHLMPYLIGACNTEMRSSEGSWPPCPLVPVETQAVRRPNVRYRPQTHVDWRSERGVSEPRSAMPDPPGPGGRRAIRHSKANQNQAVHSCRAASDTLQEPASTRTHP